LEAFQLAKASPRHRAVRRQAPAPMPHHAVPAAAVLQRNQIISRISYKDIP
jgi:hypothetical protein